MFLTLDGGDGCGKSTQIQLLGDWLKSLGRSLVLCRDPGSTPLGNAVRNILLQSKTYESETLPLKIADVTEMLLFMAARAQLVEEVIRPALEAGLDAVSDRFLLSNIVYQGYAGGVPLASLEAVGQIATGGLLPDLGIVLDIPYETAVKRIGNRAAPDRMEQKGEEYHRRVRDGFLQHAATDPDRYVIVDAATSPDVVAASIREIVQRRFL
ncbi:hypothetical protein FACS1894189_1740 [Planctomycetales bacterium]|nr:hypothetical protein FACS1894189_1740 [Planctomycetales bacterium]